MNALNGWADCLPIILRGKLLLYLHFKVAEILDIICKTESLRNFCF